MTALSILATCLAAAMSINDVGAFTNELDVCRRIRNKSSYDPLSKKTSFTSSATSISYKNHDNDAEQRSTKLTPRISKKKYKKSKNKLSYRSLDKKGIPTTEHELAHHVQTVFSDLPEFSDSDNEEDEDDEPCILSDPVEEEEDNIIASSREQLDSCKKLDRRPALVLNADYQPLRMLPLSIWSWQDTVKAVLSGKAVVVDVYPDVFVRAVSLDMPVPSVIALREYAPTGKARPAFTRRNVFLRDGYRCQYCGGLFRTSDLSLDHVEPRCFGGKLVWDNTVTACNRCNGRKGHLRLSELHHVGMELKTMPRCPSLFELASSATKFVPRRVHATWKPFLGLPMEDDTSDHGSVTSGRDKQKKNTRKKKIRY